MHGKLFYETTGYSQKMGPSQIRYHSDTFPESLELGSPSLTSDIHIELSVFISLRRLLSPVDSSLGCR